MSSNNISSTFLWRGSSLIKEYRLLTFDLWPSKICIYIPEPWHKTPVIFSDLFLGIAAFKIEEVTVDVIGPTG
jgi:hypothetical protein